MNMNTYDKMIHFKAPSPRRLTPNNRIALITLATVVVALCAVLWFGLAGSSATFKPATSKAQIQYPIGVPDITEPSGMSPPGADALPGYNLSYQNDFLGTTLPPRWDVFTGVPGGDPGGRFAASHVVVNDGVLQLNTFQDPAYGNRWITGGLCQCGVSKLYGAYFVRSRITGAGPNEVELLWPASNTWPPELDFNETGGSDTSTSATVHYYKADEIDQRKINIDMTQWHTWGVIWSPTAVTLTVDGQVWGTINLAWEIPRTPMNLDFEQRALCSLNRQCPTVPVSMQIDWVAEYQHQ
jgi:Glycosyl hydrolases family 16